MMSYEEFCNATKKLQRVLDGAIRSGEKGRIRLAERDILNLAIDNPAYAERYIEENAEGA